MPEFHQLKNTIFEIDMLHSMISNIEFDEKNH
jgi:hypothetical protein